MQDVLLDVCAALHEEYVNYTGKVGNHKAMFAFLALAAATATVCN